MVPQFVVPQLHWRLHDDHVTGIGVEEVEELINGGSILPTGDKVTILVPCHVRSDQLIVGQSGNSI